ncbi:hypothetical protein SCRM01_124c [Synechococcus phage S-CRM01]|uniref:hypothetical protein n=1 Tax=Synechococcus phage S-CRM01 TaxID=1026955 RepID=UPI000209E3B8|nr:hypothetical protein SCRM01_124c [Synechococcus phage S-CRM01]AEC53070.1 hypothetical protein SCRM01_124c [Synechococcus phage S-CRM01]
MAASVSLAVPVVGSEDNRTVTLDATVGAPADPRRPVHIYWTVVTSTIPAGFRGGRGARTVVFAPGTFSPGTYNVKCVVYDPTDDTEAEANRTFVIPKLDANLVPAPPTP